MNCGVAYLTPSERLKRLPALQTELCFSRVYRRFSQSLPSSQYFADPRHHPVKTCMPRPCLYSLPFQQGRPVLISKPLSARAVRSSKADGRKRQAGRQKFTCTCSGSLRQAGPVDPPPDYGAIDARPLNRLILARFRSKMVAALREDVSSTG